MDIRALKEELRRAGQHPNKHGSQRRDAYRRVLDLAHSSDAACKKLATERIKEYFVDFPDLQDEAINTVYDLCEDQDRDIRLAGYGCIASLSFADKRWLVRNADVVVQLLQCDDEREVAVVKQALQQHIDIDATRTLQVLCDQCIFDDEGLDTEEVQLRRRLRGLVLNFLKERQKTLVRVARDQTVSEALFKGLVNALPHATPSEATVIIKDILFNTQHLSVPSYISGATDNGNIVLDRILEAAESTLRIELSSISSDKSLSASSSRKASQIPRINIPRTCSYLALAAHLTTPLSYIHPRTGKQPLADRSQKLDAGSSLSSSADALRLLRFYLNTLSSGGLLNKTTLSNELTRKGAANVAWYVARAWEGCEDMASGVRDMKGRSVKEIRKGRDDLVDVCPSLIMSVAQRDIKDIVNGRQLRRTAHALIRACVDRERSTKEAWTAPEGFEESLQAILAVISNSKHIASPSHAEGWGGFEMKVIELGIEEPEPLDSLDSVSRTIEEIERLLRNLLEAKEPEDAGQVEALKSTENGMPFNASQARHRHSSRGSKAVAGISVVPAPLHALSASRTVELDTRNVRIRTSTTDDKKGEVLLSQPLGIQEGQVSGKLADHGITVRGAASSAVPIKQVRRSDGMHVDGPLLRASGLLEVGGPAKRLNQANSSPRPVKRTRHSSAGDVPEIVVQSETTSSGAAGGATPTAYANGNSRVTKTPSLLARMQSNDSSLTNGVSSPKITNDPKSAKAVPNALTRTRSNFETSASAPAVSSQSPSASSRGRRPQLSPAASGTGLSIKGRANSSSSAVSHVKEGGRENLANARTTEGIKIRGAAARTDDNVVLEGKLSLLERLVNPSQPGLSGRMSGLEERTGMIKKRKY